jgi:hypothetical protein
MEKKKKTKIVIICPWWGRWEVTRMHCKNIKKFMHEAPYSIEYLAIISPGDKDYNENLETAFNFGFTVCQFRNIPVSQKINAGIAFALEKFDPEYIMNMGSDDLVSGDIWQLYKSYFDDGDKFFGIDSGHAINYYTKEAIYLDLYNDKYPVGGLRMIHTDCIKRLKDEYQFNLYPMNVNSGMDTASMMRLGKIGIIPKVVHVEGRVLIAGMKCNTTINHWMHLSIAEKDGRMIAIPVEYDTVKHLIIE